MSHFGQTLLIQEIPQSLTLYLLHSWVQFEAYDITVLVKNI